MTEMRIAKLKSSWTGQVSDYVASLSWSSDGACLAVCPTEGAIVVFSSAGEKKLELPSHGMGNTQVEFHPVQPLFLTAGFDSTVRVHSLESGKKSAEHRFPKGTVDHVAWAPGGQYFAASSGKELVVLDTSAQLIHQFHDQTGSICHFCWSPSGRQIAVVGQGGIRIFDLDKKKKVREFSWAGASLRVCWSPDARKIACADQTKTTHYWDLEREEAPLHMWGFDAKVSDLCWSFDAKKLATSSGGEICVWDCSGPKGPEGTTPQVLEAHEAGISAIAYMKNGPLLASCGMDGIGFIWWTEKQSPPLAGAQLEGGATSLAWSPLATAIAFGSEGGQVVVCAPNG